MAIDKLTEFAKTGQKNTDDLDLETGFIVNRKPARQWFNWLFNTLTTKINEIIDADFMPKSDVVDNLTTNDATKPISAKQAKLLQDNKLDKTANAVSATKLQTARTISLSGGVTGTATSFDGSGDISIPVTGIDGSKITTGTIPAARIPTLNQSTTGNAATATKLATARTIGGVSFDGSANINLPGVNTTGNQNTTGNAATATRLQTARKIGGVSFDGSANINLPGVNTTGNQDTSGNAATATKLATASGNAPCYGTRSWVSFNGSGTVAIKASGNVASITDHGVGDWSINFSTAMPDANFAVAGVCNTESSFVFERSRTASSVRIGTKVDDGGFQDSTIVSLMVIR